MSKITHERLLEVLEYNQETGLFTWKTAISDKIKVGTRAGSKTQMNYIKIRVDNKYYRAHILAWFYTHGEWPEKMLDHINNVGTDNRMINLRLATASENRANSRMRKNNTSGIKGVYFDKSKGKWCARVRFEGKVTRKLFDDLEEAEAYVVTLREEMCGQFARNQ